jgi:hypothetical protein
MHISGKTAQEFLGIGFSRLRRQHESRAGDDHTEAKARQTTCKLFAHV